MLVFPPLEVMFAVAALSLICAAAIQRPFRNQQWKRLYPLALTHLFFFFAVVAVGNLFVVNPRNGPNHTGVLLLETLMYCSFASCVFWTWRINGFRWLAGSLAFLLEVMTLGALFLAGMQVTGDWL